MFGRIARRYDFANHVLSGGADFLWRYRAARKVADWQPGRVLDLATGSGDLALAISRRLPDVAEADRLVYRPPIPRGRPAAFPTYTIRDIGAAEGRFVMVSISSGLPK